MELHRLVAAGHKQETWENRGKNPTELLQCLVTSRFPPSSGFLLKVAISTFHLVGLTDRHPESWVVAAASRTFPVPLHSSKVCKATPDSRESVWSLFSLYGEADIASRQGRDIETTKWSSQPWEELQKERSDLASPWSWAVALRLQTTGGLSVISCRAERVV